MKVSFEISMYPMHPEYGTPILKFIEHLRKYPELEIRSNTMSTQVFGDFDFAMETLKIEMKRAFQSEQAVVMVMKVANLDLRPD
jgi:uncharacterized protein YqgV (UPF0045/DUF77 family)